MVRLVVVTDSETIIEHLPANAVLARLQSIMKRNKVITHSSKPVTYQPEHKHYSKVA